MDDGAFAIAQPTVVITNASFIEEKSNGQTEPGTTVP